MYLTGISGQITDPKPVGARLAVRGRVESRRLVCKVRHLRSPERKISYYNKGEILGIMLDLRIRQLSKGNKSAA